MYLLRVLDHYYLRQVQQNSRGQWASAVTQLHDIHLMKVNEEVVDNSFFGFAQFIKAKPGQVLTFWNDFLSCTLCTVH